ncbi:MAG: acetate--CoA ligase family protein [Thaumarchaeota archaeon]|nr:acetate--CoA ligase family protein [Nitrososphaerota archaeon]
MEHRRTLHGVRLFEYQGKELFKKYGIPVPQSQVIHDPADVGSALELVGLPAVIKAQVLAGGRGKAGGVVVVNSEEEAMREASRIIGLRIGGEKPTALLVEQASTHSGEMYLSITQDRRRRSFVLIVAKAGGVEVESATGQTVEPIPVTGLSHAAAVSLASRVGLSGKSSEDFVAIATALERLLREEECELAEINPLAIRPDGSLLALDSKVILDDNALFRHPEFSQFMPEDPLEGEAAKEGFAFVRLDGNVAVVGNGAGLVLSTLDLVADAGGRPACFLDLGGGSQQSRVEAALRLVKKLPNAERILVNIFGGITRTTDVAAGLKNVVEEGPMQPVYARISGAEEEAARKMLAGTPVKLYGTAPEAVRAAVNAS